MTSRTVTGNTILLTGSAQASQTVTFIKKSATISGTTITQQGTTTATTDADGNFSKALDCPVSGSTSWALICPDGSLFDFDLPYGDGSSVAVTTLITAGAVEADDVTLLLDGYVLKSGSTMTGQLNFSGSTHAGLKLLTLTTAQRDALTPANGMVIYNSTTSTVQVYQGGTWASVGSGGGAVSSVFGRTGAVVAAANDYGTDDIADESTLAKPNLTEALDTLSTNLTTLDAAKQDASAKLSAISALTWAANSLIWLTGTATASVQALASHIVTFLQSANAAAARSAISAETSGAAATVQSSLDTHAALTTSAHGGLVPQDAAILSKSGAYPLAAGDEAKIIECNGTFTITLPNGLDTGFQAVIVNIGTGVITLAATTTLTTKDSAVTLANQYGAATVYHAGSNVWRAFGDLS